MASSVQQQRDNLNIGLYLAHTRFGAPLDHILQVALGYNPNGAPPSNYVERFDRRFRAAQQVGREAFKSRTPGYFTFNAMPFGDTYLYKALWYVWINPKTGKPQTVPLPSGDLASMRQLRDRDLATRKSTTRSIRAAHNIEDQRQAVARKDWQALQIVQSRMTEDGTMGELLSGFHGLPYADIQNIMPQLANENGMHKFQRVAKDVRKLENRLIKRKAVFAQQLTNWVLLQTGVPSNAHVLALQQAQQRLAALP